MAFPDSSETIIVACTGIRVLSSSSCATIVLFGHLKKTGSLWLPDDYITPAGQFITLLQQLPLACLISRYHVSTNYMVMHGGGVFQSIGQQSSDNFLHLHLSFLVTMLPVRLEGWKAGGWSLKVISDAVPMSHAGRPLANTVIRFLIERSNQNQTV
jgi:hypothetical protein